jgi:hypothetical protein
MSMNSKARITTDFPTPQEVASRLHIPADRAAVLERRVLDLHITNPDGSISVIPGKSATAGGRNGRPRASKTAKKK